MLPAMIDRFKPALALVQSIATMRERFLGDGQKTTSSEVASASGVKDISASETDYFDGRPDVTQVMMHLFERVIGYLNKGLQGTDAAADGWRDQALQKTADASAHEVGPIPTPSDPDFSFRRAAQVIKSAFNLDFLARDPELAKLMDDTLGFHPYGMTVADLVEAFIDPSGAANEKVESVISKGLAGQEGSDALERLKEAAQQFQDPVGAIAKAYREAMAPDQNDLGGRRFFVI